MITGQRLRRHDHPAGLPSISRFLVLVFGCTTAITPPHFHARYSGQEAVIAIDSLQVLNGELPPRVMASVLEWASRRRDELRLNWDLARRGLPLNQVPPLE